MEKTLRSCLPCLRALWDRLWPEPPAANSPPARRQIAVISGPLVDPKPSALNPTPVAPRKLGPVYTALYDFQARSPEELSLKQGEKLRVIRDEGDYLFARKAAGSAEGLVPTNYVKVIENFANE
eukprot:g39672.t1